jgi:ribonuclease Z
MNLELYVIGTSGMMPLPNRFLTSVLLRRDGELMLFDCGEGTQVSLKRMNLKWKKISRIFISHMHADHVTGLPGLLMLSSQVDREMPLHIYGPPKLQQFVEANRNILDMYINYEIIVHPVTEEGIVLEEEDFYVKAFRLQHTKPCFGFTLVEHPRPGEFFPDKAKALSVPIGPMWAKLQGGEDVILEDGSKVTSSQVMGPERKGRKFSYVTDTLYTPEIAGHVSGSDFLVCEGMFDQSLIESAREKKHLTAAQAGMIASEAGGVKKMGLIHYSPRYADKDLRILLEEAKQNFSHTVLLRDRHLYTIPYPE